MSAPAVFLDRDGTINQRPAPHRYVEDPAAFRWLSGAAGAIVSLAAAGFVPVVVSNQRGVARGMVTWETLAAIEDVIQRELADRGARIAAFHYCPHQLDERCACRKPRPGLLLDAADRLDLDLTASWMIGDSASDIGAGAAAGCRTVLIGDDAPGPEPTVRVASLVQAAQAVLSPSRESRGSSKAHRCS